jgi:hypothetical protein
VTAVNDVCVVSKLDVSPTSSEAFSLTQGPVFDRLINPGECLRVEVQAEQLGAVPTSPDVVVGALEAMVSAPGPQGQVVVPLSAQRAVGCLVLSPSPMDFGVTQPGCRAAERTLTLANLCETDEVQVRSVTLWSSSTARPGTARCPGPLPCEEFSVVRAPDLSVGARCLAGGQVGACIGFGTALLLAFGRFTHCGSGPGGGLGVVERGGQGFAGGAGLGFVEVVLIIPGIRRDHAGTDVQDLFGHLADEVNVMADEHERAFVLLQRADEGVDAAHVEMRRGLIHEQEVRRIEQQAHKHEA